MTDKDYKIIIELTYMGGGWVPANQNAQELAERCVKGEVIAIQEVTQRDIRFHRCYFALLNLIYNYLPKNFKENISQDHFYKWLKHLKGEYSECYTFKDGTKLIEYDSIAFGRMSEKTFRAYVKEQLPWIYENVLGAFFQGEMLSSFTVSHSPLSVFFNSSTNSDSLPGMKFFCSFSFDEKYAVLSS